jgi:N utilization substance protein A
VETPETQISLEEAHGLIPGPRWARRSSSQTHGHLGRIAAQTAKQVIFQKVREAERDNVFAVLGPRGRGHQRHRKRQEMGDFVVDLGRAGKCSAQGRRAETYQTGDACGWPSSRS